MEIMILSLTSGSRYGISPVSYTHLDVYKRQVITGTSQLCEHLINDCIRIIISAALYAVGILLSLIHISFFFFLLVFRLIAKLIETVELIG